MSIKWKKIADNALENWNPINSIEDPKLREKEKYKLQNKNIKNHLRLARMKLEKPKPKRKEIEE